MQPRESSSASNAWRSCNSSFHTSTIRDLRLRVPLSRSCCDAGDHVAIGAMTRFVRGVHLCRLGCVPAVFTAPQASSSHPTVGALSYGDRGGAGAWPRGRCAGGWVGELTSGDAAFPAALYSVVLECPFRHPPCRFKLKTERCVGFRRWRIGFGDAATLTLAMLSMAKYATCSAVGAVRLGARATPSDDETGWTNREPHLTLDEYGTGILRGRIPAEVGWRYAGHWMRRFRRSVWCCWPMDCIGRHQR
jgi:hypothetical protein